MLEQQAAHKSAKMRPAVKHHFAILLWWRHLHHITVTTTSPDNRCVALLKAVSSSVRGTVWPSPKQMIRTAEVQSCLKRWLPKFMSLPWLQPRHYQWAWNSFIPVKKIHQEITMDIKTYPHISTILCEIQRFFSTFEAIWSSGTASSARCPSGSWASSAVTQCDSVSSSRPFELFLMVHTHIYIYIYASYMYDNKLYRWWII